MPFLSRRKYFGDKMLFRDEKFNFEAPNRNDSYWRDPRRGEKFLSKRQNRDASSIVKDEVFMGCTPAGFS